MFKEAKVTTIKERNYSIDLLRILSMLMIVSLHSVSHGVALSPVWGGVNLYSIWFHLESSVCLLAVNVFVLISGYFLVDQSFRLSRIYKLFVETFFYSWTIIGIKYIVCNGEGIGMRSLMSSILPVSYNVYWFISAYIGMYLLSPIANLLIRGLNSKQHLGSILLLVTYFSVWNSVVPFSQPMGIHRFGQSVAWFLVLYIIAAYIKKYVKKVTKMKILLLFVLTILLVNLTWAISSLIGNVFGIEISTVFTEYFYHYNSFPVIIASTTLFLLFYDISINKKIYKRLISIASPLCMGVYLIHDNPNIRDFVWSGLANIDQFNLITPFFVAGYGITVFAICMFLDFLRSQLFSLLNTRKWYKERLLEADRKLFELFNKFYSALWEKNRVQ